MQLPHIDGKTIALLLAVAVALAVVGMLLKGIAYLLVLAAVVIAGYLVLTRLRGGGDRTA